MSGAVLLCPVDEVVRWARFAPEGVEVRPHGSVTAADRLRWTASLEVEPVEGQDAALALAGVGRRAQLHRHVAVGATTLWMCSYGVAFAEAFGWRVAAGELRPPPASTGALVVHHGRPPQMWPGRFEHGVSGPAEPLTDETRAEVVSRMVHAPDTVWVERSVCLLPRPSTSLLWVDQLRLPTARALVPAAAFCPLFDLPDDAPGSLSSGWPRPVRLAFLTHLAAESSVA